MQHPNGSTKRKKVHGTSINGGISKSQLKKQQVEERKNLEMDGLRTASDSQLKGIIGLGGAAIATGLAGLATMGLPLVAIPLLAAAGISGAAAMMIGTQRKHTNDRLNQMENPGAAVKETSSDHSGARIGLAAGLGGLQGGAGSFLANLAIQGTVEKMTERPKKSPSPRGLDR